MPRLANLSQNDSGAPAPLDEQAGGMKYIFRPQCSKTGSDEGRHEEERPGSCR